MTYKYLIAYCDDNVVGALTIDCAPIETELDLELCRRAVGEKIGTHWTHIIVLGFSRLEVEKGD